jgi:hypothetical protein
MTYIVESSLVNRNGKNYLQIFLNPQYHLLFKDNGVDNEVVELFFEEPNAGDEVNLRRCSLAINKLYKYMDQYQSASFLKQIPSDILQTMLQNQVREKVEEGKEEAIKQEIKEKQIEDEEEVDETKNRFHQRLFMSKLLDDCADYENSDTDYFCELDKFISLISSKCKRELNNMMLGVDLAQFDKYKGESFFIKKAIIAEYVGFFFLHFPSQYLHAQG